MNPRILIMVLSYNVEPFSTLMRVQQDTFCSLGHPKVDTIFYHGGCNPEHVCVGDIVKTNDEDWQQVSFKCTDAYYYMAAKFQKALQWVNLNEYDIIFRTNSSSYVNKTELFEFAKTLPKEKLYAGWTFVDGEDHGGLCVSGAGIFLSPDTAKILMENIDPNFEQEEDVYCGRILRKHGITAIDDKSRYDVEKNHDYIPLNLYHYRFKGSHGSRLFDIHNMVMLHKKIISQ